jgi:2-polyprenyl-3-methyl-5-hydroxy-6-metoxy-1,4-benzoquinol methylase
MPPAPRRYDDFADAYAAAVVERERGGFEDDPNGILPDLLSLLGDIEGRIVLDAGCGEGYLARVLAARGARVVGMDMGPRLIELARRRDPSCSIEYHVAELSEPLPEYSGHFDAVASYLVLNDVEDYRGFAAGCASMLKPGGRMVHALNNPYGAVIRKHVADYFDPPRGLYLPSLHPPRIHQARRVSKQIAGNVGAICNRPQRASWSRFEQATSIVQIRRGMCHGRLTNKSCLRAAGDCKSPLHLIATVARATPRLHYPWLEPSAATR